MPKCWRVYLDLAARAPPINKLLTTREGRSVFAASDTNDVLSMMCSRRTCKLFITRFTSCLRKKLHICSNSDISAPTFNS